MRFSERMGSTPPKSIMQVGSMDEDLQNSLWNAVFAYYFGIDPPGDNLTEDFQDVRELYLLL